MLSSLPSNPLYLCLAFRYREEVVNYKEEHLKDRQLPQCYIQYMIGIINNCQTFRYVSHRSQVDVDREKLHQHHAIGNGYKTFELI